MYLGHSQKISGVDTRRGEETEWKETERGEQKRSSSYVWSPVGEGSVGGLRRAFPMRCWVVSLPEPLPSSMEICGFTFSARQLSGGESQVLRPADHRPPPRVVQREERRGGAPMGRE